MPLLAAPPSPQLRSRAALQDSYAHGSLSLPRSGASASVLGNGDVLIVSGSTADLYDSTTGSIASGGTLEASRVGHTATVQFDGRVLVAGGEPGLSSVELYNPATRVWTPGPGLANPRSHHRAVRLHSGDVIAVGGRTGSAQPLASVERLYRSVDAWVPVGSLAEGRWDHCALSLSDGRALVLGGRTGQGELATLEVYDPSSNLWSTLDIQLQRPRAGAACVALPDGSVLVIGGEQGGVPLREVELISPALTSVSAAPPLAVDRRGHAAVVLASGDVLVVGGEGLGGALATTEVLTGGAFVPGPTLPSARSLAAAVLLPSGRVLVAGGESGASAAISEMVLFDLQEETLVPGGMLPGSLISAAGVALPTGETLVMGGQSRTDAGAWLGMARIQPDGLTVLDGGQLLFPHVRARARLLHDGRVFIHGSRIEPGNETAAEICDVSGACSDAGFSPTVDSLSEAVVLPSGDVLLTDGPNSALYDPVAQAWTLGAKLRNLAETAGVLLPDGRVLVTGGAGGVAEARTEFRTADGTWVNGGVMGVARFAHRSVVLPDGTVWVVAGMADDALEVQTNTTELFAPDSETWRAGPPISKAIDSMTLAVLGSGKVAVVAGASGSGSMFDVFDPLRGAIRAGPTLAQEGRQPIVELMPDGRFVLAAGPSGTAQVLIYDEGYGRAWSPALLPECTSGWPGLTLRFNGTGLLAGSGLPVAMLRAEESQYQRYLTTRLQHGTLGELELPADALPGWYRLRLVVQGSGSLWQHFRIGGAPGAPCVADWQCGTVACQGGVCAGSGCNANAGFDGTLPPLPVPSSRRLRVGCDCSTGASVPALVASAALLLAARPRARRRRLP